MSGEEWEWDGTCSACGVEVEWRNDDGPATEDEALCHDCAYEALDNTIAALRADLAAKTADLAQASVLLRAAEARHEREHAADVEALRVLEATCTGLRGERDAKRAEYAQSIFRYEMRVAKAERDEARALLFRSEDAAGVWERAADAARADLARVTAERDAIDAEACLHNRHRERYEAAIAAADALADGCRDSGTGTGRCRLCHMANAHHAKCPVAHYDAARGGK